MKQVPIRKFTTVVGYLTEAVSITVDGQIIGVYHPTVTGPDWSGLQQPRIDVKEATVDEVKKAIEPDQVKIERPAGPGQKPRVSKGLGNIPGVTRGTDGFGYSRPAPKPGKR